MFRPICCLFVAIAANAATPLFQASFEKADSSWAVVRGSATPDASVLHDRTWSAVAMSESSVT